MYFINCIPVMGELRQEGIGNKVRLVSAYLRGAVRV